MPSPLPARAWEQSGCPTHAAIAREAAAATMVAGKLPAREVRGGVQSGHHRERKQVPSTAGSFSTWVAGFQRAGKWRAFGASEPLGGNGRLRRGFPGEWYVRQFGFGAGSRDDESMSEHAGHQPLDVVRQSVGAAFDESQGLNAAEERDGAARTHAEFDIRMLSRASSRCEACSRRSLRRCEPCGFRPASAMTSAGVSTGSTCVLVIAVGVALQDFLFRRSRRDSRLRSS